MVREMYTTPKYTTNRPNQITLVQDLLDNPLPATSATSATSAPYEENDERMTFHGTVE